MTNKGRIWVWQAKGWLQGISAPCSAWPLDMAADHAALFEVALVVLLGLPEGLGGEDLGGDGGAEAAGGVEFGDLCAGLTGLLVGVGEDDGAILRSPIGTLAVDLGGIVEGKEGIEQAFVADAGGVEEELDHLGVAGAVGTDLFVGGMLERSPFVADGGVQNSRHLAETGFHAPETSCAKRCFFSCHVLLLVTLLRFALRSVARVLGGRVCFRWCRDCFPLCWMPEGLLCHPASEKTSVKNASILRLSTDTRQSPESRRFTVTFRGLGLVSKEVVP